MLNAWWHRRGRHIPHTQYSSDRQCAQRLVASERSALGRILGPSPWNVCAQRLVASERSALARIFCGHRGLPVLNAWWHRRGRHDGLVRGAPVRNMCSTPGGIGEVGMRASGQHNPNLLVCSTPGGIGEVGIGTRCRRVPGGDVLNAWWHRRGRHLAGPRVLGESSECSTPGGIGEVGMEIPCSSS